METDTQKAVVALQAATTATRKQVLDLLELAFREHPQWPYVRSRVLRALGKSGLEGVLDRYSGKNSGTISSDFDSNGAHP